MLPDIDWLRGRIAFGDMYRSRRSEGSRHGSDRSKVCAFKVFFLSIRRGTGLPPLMHTSRSNMSLGPWFGSHQFIGPTKVQASVLAVLIADIFGIDLSSRRQLGRHAPHQKTCFGTDAGAGMKPALRPRDQQNAERLVPLLFDGRYRFSERCVRRVRVQLYGSLCFVLAQGWPAPPAAP